MKKVLSIVLIAMLVIGMAPMALASTIVQEDEHGNVIGNYGYSAAIVTNYPTENFLTMPDVDLGEEANPTNNEWSYGLGTAGWYEPTAAVAARNTYFVDNTATGGSTWAFSYEGHTRKTIKDDKVAVELRVTNGQRVVDKVEIKYLESITDPDGVKRTFVKNEQPAYILVTFKDKFVSTSEVDYKFTIYLTYDRKRDKDSEVIFEGTFKNNETTVDEGDVYVYLGDDVPVVESLAYLKDIDIELDDGITVHTKFFNNKKYYANGEAKVRAEDDEVLARHPAIDYVYNIDSVGLNNTYTTVSLNISDRLYVYNSNLEYIGTTADRLPYSTKYYVSTTELDVEGAVEEPIQEPNEGDIFEPGPEMGGDNVPGNVNDNPGTGC